MKMCFIYYKLFYLVKERSCMSTLRLERADLFVHNYEYSTILATISYGEIHLKKFIAMMENYYARDSELC